MKWFSCGWIVGFWTKVGYAGIRCADCPALVSEPIMCDCGRQLCFDCFTKPKHDRCDEKPTVVLPAPLPAKVNH